MGDLHKRMNTRSTLEIDRHVRTRVTDYANLRRISGDADPNNIPENDKLRAEPVTLTETTHEDYE